MSHIDVLVIKPKPIVIPPVWKFYTDEAPYWRYYDTAEGKDVMKKTVVTARYGAIVGFAVSAFDVVMYSHTVGAKNTLARFRYFMAPLAAMGAVFSVVANGMQNVRKKNDIMNYLAGGLAAAPIFGRWQKSGVATLVAAFGLGTAAMMKKSGVDYGWVFFPEPQMQYASALGAKYDWTMATDDNPKGYRTPFDKPVIPAEPPEVIICGPFKK